MATRRSGDLRRWIPLLILVLFAVDGARSFYLPGVAPEDFQRGTDLKVKVNKVTSTKTQLPYSYYSLPYCAPEKIIDSTENLGEVLRGDRIENSIYLFKMREHQSCKLACRKVLSANEAKYFKEKIEDEYRVNMILDNLPLVLPYKRLEPEPATIYQYGFPVGFKGKYQGTAEERYFINNHLHFTVKFHKDVAQDTARIVGFEVKPASVKHEYEGQWSEQTSLSTCNPHAQRFVSDRDPPQEVEENEEVIFTYDVDFEESAIKWASRWDTYLLMVDDQIHWFSIVNSLMSVLFLSGMVAMIMLRTLYHDISQYNQLETQEEAQEETGWKLVHADVFRPPINSDLLCVYVGTGVQFFGMILVTMIFAMLGFLSPSNRGGLMTAMLLLWALMGIFAGYASARMYKMFKGTEWKSITLKTAMMFPGAVFTVFFILNALIWGEKSSGAVPFGTMFALVFLWFGIFVPLVFVGSYTGFKKPAMEDPVKDQQDPQAGSRAGMVHEPSFLGTDWWHTPIRSRFHRAFLHPYIHLAPAILLHLWHPVHCLPHLDCHLRRDLHCSLLLPTMQRGLPLVVEVVLDFRIFSTLSLPVCNILLLHEARYHQTRIGRAVLWLHADSLLCLLRADRHHWLLCVLLVHKAHIFFRQNRLIYNDSYCSASY